MPEYKILWLGVCTAKDGSYVITEQEAHCYRVLGEYSTLAQAKRDLQFIRQKSRYAHLDKEGFAP